MTTAQSDRPASAPLVQVNTGRGVTTLVLDSPHNRNALSRAMLRQLLAALEQAVADDAVRVVVISHTGDVFCSGLDLTETTAPAVGGEPGSAGNGPPVAVGRAAAPDGPVASPMAATPDGPAATSAPTVPDGPAATSADGADGRFGGSPTALLAELLRAVWECPKPVVARIAGPARAGGLGLVAAADIAICSEQATFSFSEVRLGLIPAMISATVLPRLSSRAAAELYLTGDVFDGPRAASIGLVSATAPAQVLDATVAAYCAALVRGAPGAQAGVKELLRRRPSDTLREDLRELAALSGRYFDSVEGREGVRAFQEKRTPRWVPQGGEGAVR